METPTEHGQALPAGMPLEEFVIERVLGSGGFGITYLARDTSLGRQVVIKENLPSQFAWRETATGTVRPRHTTGCDIEDYEWSMKNFLREAETLASLDHPGIVRVLRKFEANGTAYFVMPYVEGVALDSLIEERRTKGQAFSEDDLRGILERILDALAHLHDRGICHRDIKPGNILITNESIPVLIDFGSARQRLSERSMTVVESAGYTPFEQLQSRGNVGPWSDLYALGGTLCKAITGEVPPKANDRIRKDPHVPLARRGLLAARFSTTFLSVLDKALLVNEADRWQNARDWLVALSQNGLKDLEPQEISAAVVTVKTRDANSWSGGGIGPITDSQATSGNSRRQRSLQVAGVVGLLLIAIGLLMWLAGRQRKQDPAASNDLQTPMVSAHPGEGRLMVTSDPAGALLLGETGDLFGKTPTEITGLKGGERWKGRLELPGYRSAAVEVEVHAGGTTLAPNVTLEAIPQKVVITSEPQRAEVFKDGKLLGMTPWESSLLKVGSQVNFVIRK
jgi:serine/threonine protein kinase